MRTLLHSLCFAALLALAGTALADSHPAIAPNGVPWEEIEVPELPFDDNPDPDACGIPQRFDDEAWLDGWWEGERIQPTVFFYDSHLRSEVTGMLPSGTRVRVILFQDNPVLNYYMVEGTAADGSTQRGWVPAPFLVFEPPSERTESTDAP